MGAEKPSSEMNTKSGLRRVMREQLRGMEHSDAVASSLSVCSRLERLLTDLNRPVLSFAPIRRADAGVERVEEVDLGSLHDELIARGVLALPRIDWDNRTMRAWLLPRAERVDRSRDLVARRFGVPEPAHGEPIDLEQLDAVLVPGLAFDRSGARLGRGAGFYDRFLAPLDASSRAPRLIGVCFDRQLVVRVPTEAHDRRVDTLVTESGVFPCVTTGA